MISFVLNALEVELLSKGIPLTFPGDSQPEPFEYVGEPTTSSHLERAVGGNLHAE